MSSTLFQQAPTPLPANTDATFSWTPPTGTGDVTLQLDIPTTPLSNYEDGTHSITITVIRVSDGFVVAGYTWQGGHVDPHLGKPADPPPVQVFSLGAYQNVPLHIRVQVPVAMTAGATVTG
jgi:hypothetical protein